MIINNKNVNKTNKAEKEEFNSKMSIKSNILRNYEPDNLEKNCLNMMMNSIKK